MKTKELSKKIRGKSKTLIITVAFLLFASLPGNAQKKDKAAEKKVVQTGYSLTVTVGSSNPLEHYSTDPDKPLTPEDNDALSCEDIITPPPSSEECIVGYYAEGEEITLIVPQDIDGRNIVVGDDGEEYIFYEWIIEEGPVNQSSHRTENYVNPFTFTISGNTKIKAHFILKSGAPVIDRFPVNGPHNTGAGGPNDEIVTYDDDTRVFHTGYACGNQKQFSNNECHVAAMDIHAPIGETVVAAQAGTIHKIGYDEEGGNVVIIHDDYGWRHEYIHLSAVCDGVCDGGIAKYPWLEFDPEDDDVGSQSFGAAVRADIGVAIGAYYLWRVTYLNYLNRVDDPDRESECVGSKVEGQSVKVGDIIGFVGSTGNGVDGEGAGPPHLHYEVRPIDSNPQDLDCYNLFNPYPLLYPLEDDYAYTCIDPTAPRSLDLCFVIDSSGSMWDDIDEVKERRDDILVALEEQVEDEKIDDYRISIIDFKHYYDPRYTSRVALNFTNDTDDIIDAIDNLGASGGGDPGEAVFAGLMCTFKSLCSYEEPEISWEEDARKITILLGDEPPYTGPEEFTYAEVVAAAKEGGIPLPSAVSALKTGVESTTDGIHIYSILIGNNSTAEYYFKKLAEDTGGQFFNALTANDVVDAILEAIGSIPGPGPGPGPTNSAPDVSGATASVSNIWPPNNKMVDIQILDVVDPDGDPVTITITAITQDEPVNQTGSKNKEPDAEGIGTDTAWVRAERDGNGNGGRVYEITFEASDDKGATAEGSVFVCVPHDQGEDTVCIDDGQNYDSTSSI